MATFRVNLKKIVDDSYDIEIGHGLGVKLLSDIEDGLVGTIRRFAVVTDSNVASLYAEQIYKMLLDAGYRADLIVIEAGEMHKSRESKEYIEDTMIEKGYRRDCCLIAVGGGVVTDLGGFVAGTYGRGIPLIHYATTLLAAADASVGGKSAVDTPAATNLIGLFYQPKKVFIDLDAWRSLPKREICCGLAETVKHACMADYEFFCWLEENIEDVVRLDPRACAHVAEKNCQIKYSVVTQDERERGLREVLNLGHTVGRAIETVSGYRLLHGEAVAIGLSAETELAKRLGHLSEDEQKRIRELLRRAHLPTGIPEYIRKDELLKKLYTDKKVRDDKLRFVIQDGIGAIVRYADDVYAAPIEEGLIRDILSDM